MARNCMRADGTFDVLKPFVLSRASENFSPLYLVIVYFTTSLLLQPEELSDLQLVLCCLPCPCSLVFSHLYYFYHSLTTPLLLLMMYAHVFLLCPLCPSAYDICHSLCCFIISLLCFVPMFSSWLVLIPIVTLCLTLHHSFNTMWLVYRIFSVLVCSVIYE